MPQIDYRFFNGKILRLVLPAFSPALLRHFPTQCLAVDGTTPGHIKVSSFYRRLKLLAPFSGEDTDNNPLDFGKASAWFQGFLDNVAVDDFVLTSAGVQARCEADSGVDNFPHGAFP